LFFDKYIDARLTREEWSCFLLGDHMGPDEGGKHITHGRNSQTVAIFFRCGIAACPMKALSFSNIMGLDFLCKRFHRAISESACRGFDVVMRRHPSGLADQGLGNPTPQ
jgi:hypothetical protein